MRALVTVLFLLGVGLLVAEAGHAQLRADPWSAAPSRDLRVPGASAAGMQDGPAYERIAAGTALGAVVGGAAGLGIVAMTRGQPTDANMFPWADLVTGAVIGGTAGMYLGARLSSGGQGNALMTGAAAVGGTALGLLAGVAVGSLLAEADTGMAPEVMGVALGVAIPLGLTSFAEWRAAR